MTRYPHEDELEQLAKLFLAEVPLAGFNTGARRARLRRAVLESVERQIDLETENYELPEPRLYDALRDGKVDYEP